MTNLYYVINCYCYIFVVVAENKINNKPFEIKHNVDSAKFSSHLVQINCSNEELQRRIDTFIQRKREQVNMTNIRDFCGGVTNNPNSCARVDAVLTRQKNSKSHLRSMIYVLFNILCRTKDVIYCFYWTISIIFGIVLYLDLNRDKKDRSR